MWPLNSVNTPEQDRSKQNTGRTQLRPRTLRNRSYQLARWLHVYTSMLSLLIVLFFSATGVVLNHPEWTVALQQAGLKGMAGDYRQASSGDTLSFRAPGYTADVVVMPATGSYTASVDSQGWVAALGDLHRGRDAGSAWSVALDLSGYFLIVIALTGLTMLLYLKKLRLSSILTLLVGAVMVGLLMKLALG